MSQGVSESAISIQSSSTGNRAPLPALKTVAESPQIVGIYPFVAVDIFIFQIFKAVCNLGLMNRSGDTDDAFNNAGQNQLCGSETIDEDPFVNDDQDSMGSPTAAAVVNETFVSVPKAGISMAKEPEGGEDPLFGETGSAGDGASMEWENTDDGELQHLLVYLLALKSFIMFIINLILYLMLFRRMQRSFIQYRTTLMDQLLIWVYFEIDIHSIIV